MKYIQTFESITHGQINTNLSEGLRYHIDNGLPLMESVYRIESDAWLALINEARTLWESGSIDLDEDDLILISTDAGRTGIYEGEEVLLDVPFYEGDEEIDEAEYHGRKVDLNKPFRTPGGPRKFAVYTKGENDNVIKVGFGEPGMRINNNDPKKSRSFRKRMRCDNPGPRWKARWWSCNVIRYRKLLNIKSSSPW
ncbi:MAG: hypothetical protein EBW68_01300 [Actinobacteria bacterium]|nr:hypothetical protein [Actinomycetota bacterium]